MLGNRRHEYVRVIMGADMRKRIFDDNGVCLGVVVQEHDLETDPDGDPIGFFRGMLFVVVLMLGFGLTLWVGFKVLAWFHGASP